MAFDSVTCPFCGETDFDLIGLKIHFTRGWCEVYDNVDTTKPPRAEKETGVTDANT
jgi:hypothetical protein